MQTYILFDELKERKSFRTKASDPDLENKIF